MKELTVTRIDNQGDRVLLYGADPDYRVIASVAQAADIRDGDLIRYEEYGVNFGFFIQKLNTQSVEQQNDFIGHALKGLETGEAKS